MNIKYHGHKNKNMGYRLIAILGLIAFLMETIIPKRNGVEVDTTICTLAGGGIFFGILIRNKYIHGKF